MRRVFLMGADVAPPPNHVYLNTYDLGLPSLGAAPALR